MGIQDIQALYDKRRKAGESELLNNKNKSLYDIDTQQNDVTNKYQELLDQYNQKKLDTQNQYKTLYTGLDNQFTQGQQKFYNDRNNVDVGVNQNLARLREMAAAKGWAQGGEGLQMQLQANTDRSNGLGQVRTDENNFNQGINDKRNQYGLQEQSIYNEIGNQKSAADRERIQKLADLVNKRNLIEETYLNNRSALNNSLDAEMGKDIMNFQEAESQRAAAARSAASRNSGLSNSMSSGSSYNKAITDINDIVNGKYNLSEKQRVLQRYIDDLSSQQGNEAVALNKYAQEALGKVNQQMSNFVNSGRYAGYENRRM